MFGSVTFTHLRSYCLFLLVNLLSEFLSVVLLLIYMQLIFMYDFLFIHARDAIYASVRVVIYMHYFNFRVHHVEVIFMESMEYIMYQCL